MEGNDAGVPWEGNGRAMIPRSLLALSILASCADISGASSSLTGTDEAEHSQSNMGEKNREAVRAQIEANFLLDPGMAGLEEMVVVVSVSMNPDGSITSLELDLPLTTGTRTGSCSRGVACVLLRRAARLRCRVICHTMHGRRSRFALKVEPWQTCEASDCA